MEITNISKYTQNTINNLLLSDSGKFLKADGTPLKASDLTSLKEFFDKVNSGKLASTTDKKYVLRNSRYVGGPDENNKSPDNVVNFDHLVVSGIPSTADIEQYEKVIKEQYQNFDYFYISNGKPQLIVGKREVETRIDKKPNGDNHIHILVNRRSVVDRQYLEEKMTVANGAEEIECIKQALDHMKGFSGALSQSCDFNDHYVQKAMYEKLNLELQANGLAPLSNYASYSQNKESNVKATQETKTDVLEIKNSGYDVNIVEKVLQKATDINTPSSLDTVILSKKQEENNKRLSQIMEEARRLTAEQKQLEEAQNSITANIALQAQLEKAKAEIENKEKAITEKDIALEEVKNLITEIKNDFENEKGLLKVQLNDKDIEFKGLSKEYDDLLETSQIELKQKDDELEKSNKEKANLQQNNTQLTQLNNALQGNIDSKEEQINLLKAQLLERDSNLKQQAELLQSIEEQRKLENDKLAEKVKIVISLEEANRVLRTDNDSLEKSVISLQNSLNIVEKAFTELKVWAESFVEKVKEKVKTPAVKKELEKVIDDKPKISEKSALNDLLALSKAGKDTIEKPKTETDKPSSTSQDDKNKNKPKLR